MKMKKTKLKHVIGVACTILGLYWIVSQIEVDKLKSALTHGSPGWLVVGVVLYGLVYIWRTLRFKVLLESHKLTFKEMYTITALHNVAVRVLPNPGGEIVFMAQTKKRNVGYAESIATLAVYRAFDFLALLILFCIAVIPMVSSFSASIQVSMIMGGAGIIVSAAMLVVISKKHEESANRVAKVFGKIPKIGAKIAEKVKVGMQAFQKFNNKTYAKVTMLSIAVWVSMLGAYLCFLWAAGMHIGFREVVIGGVVQVVANVIPNIAGLGVMEIGWVAGLSLANVAKSDAIAGAVVVDSLTLVGTGIIGCIGLYINTGLSKQRTGLKVVQCEFLKTGMRNEACSIQDME